MKSEATKKQKSSWTSSSHSNGLECVAFCRGCRGPEWQNGVKWHCQNDNGQNYIENRFVTTFLTSFSVHDLWKYNYISKNICITKTESIWWEPNSPESFIKWLIIFLPIFVAEIYGFYNYPKMDTQLYPKLFKKYLLYHRTLHSS